MEQELRNKVKRAAIDYYEAIYGEKKDQKHIPPSGKLLGKEELCNMIDASLDMWLTTGRFNLEFEKKFAEFLGVKYARCQAEDERLNAQKTLINFLIGFGIVILLICILFAIRQPLADFING